MPIRSRSEMGFQVLINLFLVLMGLIILIPLWRVLIASVTPLETYTRDGVQLLLPPSEWSTAAYRQLLTQPRFLRATMISTIITVSGTALNLFLTVPLAYGLSTRSLPGRKLIVSFILFTYLFSAGLVPTYLVVMKLDLIDKLPAVILPTAISVYNTLVMKTFFEGLPEEIKEAARIDGASDLQILLRVILPLSKPILLTIGLFYAVSHWNEFFSPILYLSDSELMPLPVLLRNILISADASLNEFVEYDAFSAASIESLKSAGVFLTMLPMLLLYPTVQRHFTKGTLVGGVKE